MLLAKSAADDRQKALLNFMVVVGAEIRFLLIVRLGIRHRCL